MKFISLHRLLFVFLLPDSLNMASIARIKGFIRILIGILLGLYIGILVLLNIPFVQKRLAVFASNELRQILNTEVSVGHVDIGFLNRIIIEDVQLNDQQGNELLKIARLSTKFEILPLFEGKIRINSVQLLGFSALLKKEKPDATPNYQFVLDAFASKDTTSQNTSLDLRINTVIMRRGHLTYDILSEPQTPGIFNSSHIGIDDMAATISLKALRSDTLNMAIRRISFKEQSGFELKKLSLKALANNHSLDIKSFAIELPNSTLGLDHIHLQYDSLHTLPLLTESTIYKGKLRASLDLTDLAPLIPIFTRFNLPINLSASFMGQGKNLDIPTIHVSDNRNLNLSAEGSIRNWHMKQDMLIDSKLSQLQITQEGISYLLKNLTGKVPPVLERMQFIDLNGTAKGKLNAMTFEGNLQTGAGKIQTNMVMNMDRSTNRSYSGQIASNDLNLGILLNNQKKYGTADFNIQLQGFNYRNQYPESTIKGIISSLEYSNYRYENIIIDGLYKDGGFNGNLSLNDENGTIHLNGAFNTTTKVPQFDLKASVLHLRPHELNLSEKYKDADISMNMTANFTGNSVDNLNGYIQLDSLVLSAPDEQRYFLKNLTVTAGLINGEKELHIQSPFMDAWIKGNYSYPTIPSSIMHIMQKYIPSLIVVDDLKQKPNNHFKFNIQIDNSELFEKLFYLPVHMHMPSSLKGYVDDTNNQLRIEGTFPSFTYNGTLYESGSLFCENPSDQFNCSVRGSMLMNSGAMINLSLDAQAQEDQLKTHLYWGNNTNVTYGGRFHTTTRFSMTEDPSPVLSANIDIHPTQMILNDTIWNIQPSHIAVESGHIYVDNFLIERAGQHLRVNGKLADTEQDSCIVDLKDINVKYVLDILQFDDVEFDGLATGLVHLKNIMKSPIMHTHLNVHNFKVNKALLGEADIKGVWDNELPGIRLDANIAEKGLSATHVTGYVSPKLKGLDLNIEADSTNIALIAPFLEGIFSEMKGRVNGNVRLYGPFKFLDLEGSVLANLNTKIDILNTNFLIKNDSIHIQSGEIAFNNVRIYDHEGNQGIVNGYLHHNKLKNLMYRFDIQTNNLLVYHTEDPGNMTFYGKVYGSGNILLDGGNNAMNVNVSLTTGRNTSFTYVSGITTEATSNQFITFVDKTPKRIQDSVETDFYHYSDAKKKEEEEGPAMDLRINMLVDATPDALMKVVMDPVTGDHITARGNGNLQVNFYNKGDFRMFGNYIIDEGMYKLSMQEVIRKDFNLQSGGTVTFTGNPNQANLDLQAVYTVNSVSLSDLSVDASLNNSTIKVNCLMNITGNLDNPTIKFDLELPTVNEEDRELVRSATSTEEQMNTQIIYLLTIGKFYTVDYTNDAYRSSNATSSLAFNTLSGQLNNMLSQWTENKNWNIGANLSTGQEGWSDVEAEAILSGRLLNNRLLINGNFGYRENVLANTNFIGDFEAVWLLTPNGEFRLRGYNQTNDRYFTKSTLTTQGVGFIYKKDFDKWSELFKWFLKKRHQIKNKD